MSSHNTLIVSAIALIVIVALVVIVGVIMQKNNSGEAVNLYDEEGNVVGQAYFHGFITNQKISKLSRFKKVTGENCRGGPGLNCTKETYYVPNVIRTPIR